jgi:transaldolase
MTAGYFHRVTQETPTRLWINNPTLDELEKAIAAGAISCTTNPTYASKLLKSEPDAIRPILDRAIRETQEDDTAAERICREVTAPLIERLRPLYERSGGTQGFVTIQDDPRKEDDWERIVTMALRCRELGPNFMAKIPVTHAGLRAMEALIGENVPICATEVFALDQALAVGELYGRTAARTGYLPPFYITHIAGIFDEYLGKVVQQTGLSIAPDRLAWAGAIVGRTEYRLLKACGYRATMLGGGARGTHHFTDFVGGDIHITINWSTAQELIKADPPVVPRMETPTSKEIEEELQTKLPDFRLASTIGALPVEEFAEFGPVVLFRSNFIAGYEHLLAEIAARRLSARQI